MIFGEWQNRHKGEIFSEDWESKGNGRKNSGYNQSREHIRLVEQDGYTLMTFPMFATDESANTPRPRIKRIEERLYRRNLVREGRNWYAEGGVAPESTVPRGSGEAWTRDELKASVETYLAIQSKFRAGEDFTKKSYYQKLAHRFGRSTKSIEYRMQNISYVLSLHGRDWVPGLAPAKNVGTNVAAEIEIILAEIEGREVSPSIAFEAAVQTKLDKIDLGPPAGEASPKKVTTISTGFERKPEVKAWVLKNAKGTCESCEQPAPFMTPTGQLFLEVHHVRSLAEGGGDSIENAVAVCPNCHRAFHHSRDKKKMLESLFSRITRLARE